VELSNIIASLSRSRIGAALVILQIAFGMAIVSNAVFVIHLRNQEIRRPTGLDEANLFTITDHLISGGQIQGEANLALLQRDLDVLRSTPDVVDAYVTSSLPFLGRYESGPVSLHSIGTTLDRLAPQAASFYVDDHALHTLGLRLVEGRWFYPKEVHKTFGRPERFPVIIVTQALADRLFPKGNAVGSSVYITNGATLTGTSTVIGIVATLDVPDAVEAGSAGPNTYLVPWARDGSSIYVIRARPGRMAAAMRETQARLRASNPLRVIVSVAPFSDSRWEAFRLPRSTVMILVAVCTLLLAITAFGIVGLTSYWISQRRHHIGMRRALGARRGDILIYYQTENLLLASLGLVAGSALAMGVNLWLMRTFAVQQLDWRYVVVGAVCVLALGQISSFLPAYRAASISPADAARAR